MLHRLDRPAVSVWNSGKKVLFMMESIYRCVWFFLMVFTTTDHFPEDSVRYVGSRPTTEGIVRRRILRTEFMVLSGILRMGTIPIWARKRFCWMSWFLTAVVSVEWMRPWRMKWKLKSEGGIISKTDDLISRDFNRVESTGWYLIS